MAGTKKTAFAARMDEVQTLVDPDLKRLGFRKFSRNYNRLTEDGLIQVVNFQMGPYEPSPPGVPPVPEWLKPNLHGNFAINLGVYVDEINDTYGSWRPGKSVPEAACTIRMRLGRLMNKEGREYWWNLEHPASRLVEDFRPHLLADGIAFLDRFGSRPAIIRDWVAFNETAHGTTPRARLAIGIMLVAKGEKASAERMFLEHLSQPLNNPHHADYVRKLAAKLGLDLHE